jgi:hypothetical protein
MHYVALTTLGVALATFYLGLQTRKQNANYRNSEKLNIKPYCRILPNTDSAMQNMHDRYCHISAVVDETTGETSRHHFLITLIGSLKNYGSFPAKNVEIGIELCGTPYTEVRLKPLFLSRMPACQLLGAGETIPINAPFPVISERSILDTLSLNRLKYLITAIELYYEDVHGHKYSFRKNIYSKVSSNPSESLLPEEFFDLGNPESTVFVRLRASIGKICGSIKKVSEVRNV